MLKFTDRRSLFGVTRRRRFVFRPTLPALVAWGVILAITSADLFAQSNRYLEIQDKGITNRADWRYQGEYLIAFGRITTPVERQS